MAKEVQQPAGSAIPEEHPGQAWLDQLGTVELATLKPFGEVGVAVGECWADMVEESARFMADRIKQDVRLVHAMLHCKRAADLQSLQADFLQTMINNYQGEMARMSELGSAMGRAMTGQVEDKAA